MTRNAVIRSILVLTVVGWAAGCAPAPEGDAREALQAGGVGLPGVQQASPGSSGGWSIDRPAETIPDVPLGGSLFGRAFEPGEITINKAALTFKSARKNGLWPDGEVTVFLGIDDIQEEHVVTPLNEGMLPHVHTNFAVEGRHNRATLMYTEMYSMRLVVDRRSADKIYGRIHISLPDYKQSYLIGRFEADVR